MNTPYINPPRECDLCKIAINNCFFDGKTSFGFWANMCPFCYSEYGSPDLVTKYIKVGDCFVKAHKEKTCI